MARLSRGKTQVKSILSTVLMATVQCRECGGQISQNANTCPHVATWDTPEHYAELLKLIPYKGIGEVEEIGRAAVWLASDDSDYVHGITLLCSR